MKFMINCDEATTICDKNQYGEATLWEKIRLSFHLITCKLCKKYTKQNSLMSQLFGKHLTPCEGTEKLSSEAKEKLKKNLQKEIENSN